ncbi:MAG TPA: DUF1634 domain-containing protein [Bryobacteraceae bacterium]|nr:DUF1634 domain-containing protein [Bryobacteraceae bacterium]
MRITDTTIERNIGRLLQWGVLVSGLVMLTGAAIYLKRYGFEQTHYRQFHGVPAEFKSPAAILREVLNLRARAIIQLGVLLMIATPVLRVVFAVGAFLLERDWLYAGISAVVLALLSYALFG